MSITPWETKNLDEIDESSLEFDEMLRDARNGCAQAQHALGMWYEMKGVCESAGEWYKKAADQGHKGAEQAYADLFSAQE